MRLVELLAALQQHEVRLVESMGGGPPRLRAPRPPPPDLLDAARAHRDVVPGLLRLAAALHPAAVHLVAELVEDRAALAADTLASLRLFDGAGLVRRVEAELLGRGEVAANALVAGLFRAEVALDAIELARLEAMP